MKSVLCLIFFFSFTVVSVSESGFDLDGKSLLGLRKSTDEIHIEFSEINAGRCRRSFCFPLRFYAALILVANYDDQGKTKEKRFFLRKPIFLSEMQPSWVEELDLKVVLRRQEVETILRKKLPSAAVLKTLDLNLVFAMKKFRYHPLVGLQLEDQLLAQISEVSDLQVEIEALDDRIEKRKIPTYSSFKFSISFKTDDTQNLNKQIERLLEELLEGIEKDIQEMEGSPDERFKANPGSLRVAQKMEKARM